MKILLAKFLYGKSVGFLFHFCFSCYIVFLCLATSYADCQATIRLSAVCVQDISQDTMLPECPPPLR